MNTTNHRPLHFDEMIGQEAIKQKARIAIQAALQRGEPLPHVLLTSSGGGLGKTSFAGVLANEMFSPLVTTTGQCLLSPADLRNLLIRIEPNTVLLVDEFHGIGRAAAEELLLVLEEGVLNVNIGCNGAPLRIDVPRFTLCAASTQPESISAPLQQRFGLTFRFDFYTSAQVCEIIRGIFSRWNMEIDEAASQTLGLLSRGVPRIGLRLSERVRDVAQAQAITRANSATVELAMRIEGIDDLGLNCSERHLLLILTEADPRPVSARSIALALGTGVRTVQDVLEPPLVRLGLMFIGAGGRRLTAKGRLHVEAVGMSEFQ